MAYRRSTSATNRRRDARPARAHFMSLTFRWHDLEKFSKKRDRPWFRADRAFDPGRNLTAHARQPLDRRTRSSSSRMVFPTRLAKLLARTSIPGATAWSKGCAPSTSRDTCASRVPTQTAYMYSTYDASAKPPTTAKSWCLLAARTSIARASISTTLLPAALAPAEDARDHRVLQSRDRVDRLRHLLSPVLRPDAE